MSTDSLKPVETSSSEAQTASGWDPFTVWRERVHKPRARMAAARTAVREEPPLVVLQPIKHRG